MAEVPTAPVFDELGTTGLLHWSGRVNEEWLRQLVGTKGKKIYREMRDNDSTVGAVLFAIDMLMRQVSWLVEPASKDPADAEAADFLETCMQDMSQPWENTLSEVFSFLWQGFSYHEVVYKIRDGASRRPERRSKFSDQRIGWRKMPIRAQTTIERWMIDEDGGIQGAIQRPPLGGNEIEIPIERALLFRTTSHKNNPEGRSILRNAFRAWYFRKRIEEVEGIGIERDTAGLCVIKAPSRIMAPTASPAEQAMYEELKKIARNVRRDEQEGIVFPGDRDDNGNPLYEITLLSSGGQRQFDTNTIINRYKLEIALVTMADFILLGHEKVGSYALSEDKSTNFAIALSTWLAEVASVMNEHAVPRLFAFNTFNVEQLPKLVPAEVKPVDLEKLAKFIKETAGAGMEWFPDENLENRLREKAKLPEKTEEA